jgi:hypothetical protein
VQESTDKVFFLYLGWKSMTFCNEFGGYTNGEGMFPEFYHFQGIEVSSIPERAHDSGTQEHIFNGVDSEHNDGAHNGGDFLGQSVIRGVDQPENFRHQNRIDADDPADVSWGCVALIANGDDLCDRRRQGGHSVDVRFQQA